MTSLDIENALFNEILIISIFGNKLVYIIKYLLIIVFINSFINIYLNYETFIDNYKIIFGDFILIIFTFILFIITYNLQKKYDEFLDLFNQNE